MHKQRFTLRLLAQVAVLLFAQSLLCLSMPAAAQDDDTVLVPLDWELTPDGFNESGKKFRLLFITVNTRDATSTDIDDYNTFVQTNITENGHEAIKPFVSHFRVVGSTSAVDARDNINMPDTGGVPVYWLNGPKIADDYSDFWDGSWDNNDVSASRNSGGDVYPRDTEVFTGTGGSVSQKFGRIHGDSVVTGARKGLDPIAGQVENKGSELPFYGVSPVFQVEVTLRVDPLPCETVTPDWSLTPDEIGIGQSFRLLFVSQDKTAARSADIGHYNALVEEDVAANGRAFFRRICSSIDFKTLGSTEAVDARDNIKLPATNTSANASVFWLGGDRIANDNVDFWDGSWDNPDGSIKWSSGVTAPSSDVQVIKVWTGTQAGPSVPEADRGKSSRYYLSGGIVTPIINFLRPEFATIYGLPSSADANPIEENREKNDNKNHLYGVSQRLTVGPPTGCNLTIPFDSPLKPAAIAAGGQFRMVFVSSDTTVARSANIGDYNDFVQRAFRENGHQDIRACASAFRALGSTSEVDARDNINMPVTGGVPIYWLGGGKVADDYADFWDNTRESGSPQDEKGERASQSIVWTGTGTDGQKTSTPLGGVNTATNGDAFNTTKMINSSLALVGNGGALYGVSPIFTVAAEVTGMQVDFKQSVYETKEGDDHLTVTLQRSDISAAVDIPILINSIKHSVSFDLGESEASVDIRTVGDEVDGEDGFFVLSFDTENSSFPDSIVVGGITQAVGIIKDNDATELSLSAPVIVSETERSITVQLGRMLAGAEQVELTLKLTGATYDTGYTAACTEIGVGVSCAAPAFNADKSETDIVISLSGGADSATLTLRGVGSVSVITAALTSYNAVSLGGGINTPQGAMPSQQILFTDPTIVSLSRTGDDDDIIEGTGNITGGKLQFEVSLGKALAAGERADVPLIISGDGITADDFGPLSLTAGQSNTGVSITSGTEVLQPIVIFEGAGAQTANLELEATDYQLEQEETATVALKDDLTTGSGTVPLSPSTTTAPISVKIIDDEYVLCFPKGAYSVYEDEGKITIPVSLYDAAEEAVKAETASLRSLNRAIDIGLEYTDLSTNGDDYTPAYTAPNFTTIAAGTRTINLEIPVVDDNEIEKDELVRIAAIAPQRPAGLSHCTTELVIEDRNFRDIDVSLKHTGSDAVFEGRNIEFNIETNRPLIGNERIEIPLQISGTDMDITADDFVGIDNLEGYSFDITGATSVESRTLIHPQVLRVASDSAEEGAEVVTIALGATTATSIHSELSVSNNPSTTNTFSVIVEDVAFNVCFSEAEYTVNEDVGNAVLPITLSSTQTDAILLAFRYENIGMGIAASDYTAVNMASIPAGQSSYDLEIPITDDDENEAAEGFAVGIITDIPAAPDCVTTATVTITDNDPIIVSLTSDDEGEITEGESATFKVSLSKRLEATHELSVPLLFTGESTSTDYGLSCRTDANRTTCNVNIQRRIVTFSGGEMVATVTITAIEDNTDEDDETVMIGFLRHSLSGIDIPGDVITDATNRRLDFTITDAPPAVSFSQASYEVTEGDAPAQLMIQLNKNTEKAVTIPVLVVADGTTDTETVTITANSQSASFTLPIGADDDMNEPDRIITVIIDEDNLPEGVTIGDTPRATLTIQEDDPMLVALTSDDDGKIIKEGESATFEVSLSRRLVGEEGVFVQWNVLGSTTTPTDYVLSCKTDVDRQCIVSSSHLFSLVHFHAGGRVVTVTLEALEDETAEPGGETLRIRISRVSRTAFSAEISGGVEIDPDNDSLSFTIVDVADAPPAVSFSQASYEVDEGAAVELMVELDKAAGNDIVIPLLVADATTRVTIAANNTTASFIIAIEDNAMDEPDRTITVAIDTDNLPEDAAVIGTTAMATVVVKDNDPTIVSLSSSQAGKIFEGDAVNLEVSLSRALVEGEALMVPLSISATAMPDDYTLTCQSDMGKNCGLGLANTPPMVSLTSGETTATLTLTTIADNVYESVETMTISLGMLDENSDENLSGGAEVHDTDKSLDFTIVDVSVGFTQSNITVNEDADSVELTVTLDRTVDRNIDVPLMTDATTQSLVTIEANSMIASLDIPIAAAYENTTDDPDRTITIAIDADNLPGGVAVAATGMATVTITDDDPTVVQLTSSLAEGASIPEGDVVTVQIILARELVAPEELSVPLEFTGGAMRDVDYTLTCPKDVGNRDCSASLNSSPSVVTLMAGERSATVELTTTPDDVDDDDEMVTIALGMLGSDSGVNLDGGAEKHDANNEVEFTIGAPPEEVEIGFTQAEFTVDEGGRVTELLKFNVVQLEDTEVILRILTDGAADATTQSVTIAALSKTVAYDVPIANDDIDGQDQTLTIAIDRDSLPDDVEVGAIATATVVVKDNDPTIVQLRSSQEGDVFEGEAVSLEVSLSRALIIGTEALMVPLEFTGMATRDVDYTLGCQTDVKGRDCRDGLSGDSPAVAFTGGETSATLTLMATPDDDAETDDTVIINLGMLDASSGPNLSGGAVADDPGKSLSFTIVDVVVEPIMVGFSQPRYEVNEGAGSVELTVALDKVAEEDIEVPLLVTDAITESSTMTTITAGNTTTSYVIAIADGNDMDEPDRIITAVIDADNLPEGVEVGAIATATVVVKDDDPTIVRLSSSQAGDVFEGDAVSLEVSLGRALVGEEALMVPLTFSISATAMPDDYTLTCQSDMKNKCGEGLANTPPMVSLTSGETTATLTFTAIADKMYDSGEDVVIRLGELNENSGKNLNGGAIAHGSDVEVIFILIDLSVGFTSSDYEVNEDVGSVELTVALDKPVDRDIIVPLLVTTEAATQSSVTIEANSMTASYVIPITDDEIDEPNQTIIVAIDEDKLPGSITVAATGTATVTIKDDDPTIVQLTSSLEEDEDIAEGRVVEIQITLGRELSGAEGLTVPLLFSGTTTQTDYELRSCKTDKGRECSTSLDNSGNLLVTLTDGDQSATLKLLTIPDDEEDIGEILIIRLGMLDENSGVNLNGGVAIDTEEDEVEIEIGDRPDIIEIEFVQAEFEVAEGGRLAELLKLVDHIRSSDTEVILRMLMSGTTQSVTIAALSETVGYDSPIPDDDIDGQDRSFMLVIERSSLPDDVAVGAIATATVVVKDNDPTIVQLISSQEGEVFEGDAVSFEVSLSRALVGKEALTVPLTFSISATATPDDYTLTCQSDMENDCGVNLDTNPAISFIDGDTTATLTLLATADNVYENAEDVMISLGTLDENSGEKLSGGAAAHTTNRQVIFIIIDAQVSFTQSGYEVNEDIGSVELTVVLDKPVGRDIIVPLLVTTEAATQSSVTIEANSMTASYVIPITDDDIDEPDQTIIVAIDEDNLPDGVTVGATATATVLVKDDDPTIVQLTSQLEEDASIAEGGQVVLQIILGRELVASEALTVPLVFAGMATRDVDYTTLSCQIDDSRDCRDGLSGDSPAVAFLSGETTATLTLSITADEPDEADEMVTIDLGTLNESSGQNLSGGAASGANNQVSFTITDSAVAPGIRIRAKIFLEGPL